MRQEYDYIGTPTGYGYAQAQKEGKKGIISVRNEVVMPFNYYDIIPFTDSLFIVITKPPRERPNPHRYLE